MSPMVVETLKLGIAILNGGNAGVQQVRGTPSGLYRLLRVCPLDGCHAPGKRCWLHCRGPTHNHPCWCLSLVANYISVAGNTDKTRAGSL